MSENSDYWKELLGDDYNEELMSILNSPSEENKPADQPPQPGKPDTGHTDETDDGVRFYDYDGAASYVTRNNTAKNKSADAINPEMNDKADDFNVNFDFEGEYRDVPDNRPLRQRREKRTGCVGGILYAVFIICVCLLLASLLWLAATDVLGLGNEDDTVQVTVAQGFTADTVIDTLYQGGLIKYKFLFKLYAEFSHATGKITVGTYELNKNYDYRALINGMSAHGGKRVEVSVTIPEGFTMMQIFQLFAANKVCTEDELWDAAAKYDFKYDFLDKSTLGQMLRLEGFLFPDTYTFYVGDSPTRTISKMLDNFNKKFTPEYLARAKELGYSVRDIVNIAAMIEKEAGNDAERSLVASVIYNRLKSKSLPYLQIDATVYYAIAGTSLPFSTSFDNPFNTYKYKGLPAGPIANPGILSIKAALYPQSTGYYFYALNKNKAHNFFKDADSFNAFVRSDQFQSAMKK